MRFLLLMLWLVVLVAPAQAAPRLSEHGAILGAAERDRVGSAVASAGDVNGDGITDVIVGEQHARSNAGAAYVVFGRRAGGQVSLGRLGSRGFRIVGEQSESRAGFAVAGAGDVNGDGLDDVVVGGVGGHLSDVDGGVWVVYGRRGGGTVDLARLGADGFKITGPPATQFGFAVDGAGDVNGDGLTDVVVGDASDNAWVVFGARTNEGVDTEALGARGFLIDFHGFDVAGIGDLDGDGFDDVAVTDDELGTLVRFGPDGERGHTILGEADAVAAAGDVNGDGRPDLIIGSQTFGPREDTGRSWVVFGSGATKTLALDRLGARGFVIRGIAGEYAGAAVDGAGDLDGDGRADLVIGGYGTRGSSRGAAYVVRGQASTATVDLSRAQRFAGPAGARAGWTVAGLANADGRGHAGFVVGAPYVNGRRGRASLYVAR